MLRCFLGSSVTNRVMFCHFSQPMIRNMVEYQEYCKFAVIFISLPRTKKFTMDYQEILLSAKLLSTTERVRLISALLGHSEEDYHIQNVNSIHHRLKRWIDHTFWGVSTKYLQNYLGCFRLNEKLKGSASFAKEFFTQTMIPIPWNVTGTSMWVINGF